MGASHETLDLLLRVAPSPPGRVGDESSKCVCVRVPRGLPDSKGSLLRFIQEVHGHYLHQRPLHTPVVVHCR